MKKFFLNLQFLFRPSFWLMNYSYCPIHDIKINNLLNKYSFRKYDRYGAFLGDTYIWMANYPYSVGMYEYRNCSRPSRLSILRLRKKFIEDSIREHD